MQGAYPVATFAITTTNTETASDLSFTIVLEFTTGYTTVETVVANTTTIIYPTAKSGSVTAPSCALPSIVPQCQSQWDLWLAGKLSEILPFTCSYSNAVRCSSAQSSWDSGLSSYLSTVYPVIYAAGGYAPICTQASVAPSGCSQLVSSFLVPPDAAGGDINGAHVSISPWPSKSTLAPGCTLGCQTCAITGNSVQLFYWPPATAADVSGVAQPTTTTAARGSTEVLNINGAGESAILRPKSTRANEQCCQTSPLHHQRYICLMLCCMPRIPAAASDLPSEILSFRSRTRMISPVCLIFLETKILHPATKLLRSILQILSNRFQTAFTIRTHDVSPVRGCMNLAMMVSL